MYPSGVLNAHPHVRVSQRQSNAQETTLHDERRQERKERWERRIFSQGRNGPTFAWLARRIENKRPFFCSTLLQPVFQHTVRIAFLFATKGYQPFQRTRPPRTSLEDHRPRALNTVHHNQPLALLVSQHVYSISGLQALAKIRAGMWSGDTEYRCGTHFVPPSPLGRQ